MATVYKFILVQYFFFVGLIIRDSKVRCPYRVKFFSEEQIQRKRLKAETERRGEDEEKDGKNVEKKKKKKIIIVFVSTTILSSDFIINHLNLKQMAPNHLFLPPLPSPLPPLSPFPLLPPSFFLPSFLLIFF